MEYQKITNLINGHQISFLNLEQKNWVEINDESRGTYNLIAKSNLKLQC